MEEELSLEKLKSSIGKKVDVLAFGISYVGELKEVDLHSGTIRVEDKEDYVVLEIERIESFRLLRR